MVNALNYLRQAFGAYLPRSCLLCHTATHSQQSICAPCVLDLPRLGPHCLRCALPLSSAAEFCGECLRQPPAFDLCRAAFPYAAPIGPLISQFKHQRNLSFGAALGHILAAELARDFSQTDRARPDFISPVPLHWRRLLGRGFNQSHYLATLLAHALELPLLNSARRIRPTDKQQALKRKARLRNLREAFVVDAKVVAGKHVALVDDVVTTGATAEALSLALKQAGALHVEVWALARTPAPTG